MKFNIYIYMLYFVVMRYKIKFGEKYMIRRSRKENGRNFI